MSEEVKAEAKLDAKAKKAESKKVRLTIASGEADADKGDVVLAHNFKQILIQRDKEVVVDDVFVEVLKHATIESTVKDDNGVLRTAKVPRFAFQVAPA
jgi:hypothetical protein